MNLLEELEINQELLSKTEVRLTMPIKPKHLQPYGLLHGGLNAVLAESAASLGTNLYCQPDQFPVGLDITTHHLKAAQAGKTLTVIAKPLSTGRTIHVWQAKTYLNQTVTSFSTITLKINRK